MAWRAIQDTVGTSESLAELSDRAERLWWRMLALSDPWGRLDARPRKLRASCFPMLPQISDEDAGRCLLELQQAGRIIVWEKDGKPVIQIVDFEANQPREAFRKRPPESRYPTPPASLKPVENFVESLYGTDSGDVPETETDVFDMQGFPEAFRNYSGSVPDERRGEEKEKEKREDLDVTSSSVVARAREALDDDDLEKALQQLGPSIGQLARWTTALQNEPDRTRAALTVAVDRGTNAAAYFDELIRNGSWPQDKPTRSTLPACPECGPIHLPQGTTMSDHRHRAHGVDA